MAGVLGTAGRPGGGFGFLRTDLRELVLVEDAIMYPDHPDPAERAYPVRLCRLATPLRRMTFGHS